MLELLLVCIAVSAVILIAVGIIEFVHYGTGKPLGDPYARKIVIAKVGAMVAFWAMFLALAVVFVMTVGFLVNNLL